LTAPIEDFWIYQLMMDDPKTTIPLPEKCWKFCNSPYNHNKPVPLHMFSWVLWAGPHGLEITTQLDFHVPLTKLEERLPMLHHNLEFNRD
jgi:hypothetical protein